MMKKLLITFCLASLPWIFSSSMVQAADFNLGIEVSYEVSSLSEVKVIEERTVENRSSTQIISGSNKEEFVITDVAGIEDDLKKTIETINVTVDGKKHDYTVIHEKGRAKIIVEYPAEVRQNQRMVFRLVYTSYSMIKKSGAVYDFVAPGLAVTKDESKELDVIYKAFLKLKQSLPKMNFLSPQYSKSTKEDSFVLYSFEQEELMNNNIWVQFGSKQYYEFTYQMEAKATDENNLGLVNTYKLVMPRDMIGAKVEQKVFYKSISPEPTQVQIDDQGNVFLIFSESSNKDFSISIEGYVEINELDRVIEETTAGTMDSYKVWDIGKYLRSAEYWEVNHEKIQNLAKELKGEENSSYKIILKTYEYLVKKINYNSVKKFGLNPRQGALLTLEKGSGVCMEYSDLFITLARAQGIPARAAFGYGHDPLDSDSLKEPHQWAEVLFPGYEEWVGADITWGLSGKILIGGDLNHIYTHVSFQGPEEIANVSRVSYGKDQVLDLPLITFAPVERPDIRVNYKSQRDIIEEYKEPKHDNFFEMIAYKVSLAANDFKDVDFISKIFIVLGLLFLSIPLGTAIIKRLNDRSNNVKAINVRLIKTENIENGNIIKE